MSLIPVCGSKRGIPNNRVDLPRWFIIKIIATENRAVIFFLLAFSPTTRDSMIRQAKCLPNSILINQRVWKARYLRCYEEILIHPIEKERFYLAFGIFFPNRLNWYIRNGQIEHTLSYSEPTKLLLVSAEAITT